MVNSDYDPCIFMGKYVICVIYVEDLLLFSKEDKYIDALVEHIHDHKFELEYEDKIITGFPGLDIDNTGTIN